MPKLLDRVAKSVRKSLKKRGKTKGSNEYAIATAALQRAGLMKKGSHKLTKKGRRVSRRKK